jgi:hypothetical protein
MPRFRSAKQLLRAGFWVPGFAGLGLLRSGGGLVGVGCYPTPWCPRSAGGESVPGLCSVAVACPSPGPAQHVQTCRGSLPTPGATSEIREIVTAMLARGAAWQIARGLAAPVPTVSGHGLAIHHPRVPIEIVDRWTPGWDTDDLIDTADVIDGIRFMPLRHVFAWKQHAARPKDLPDIAAIRNLYALWTSPAHHDRERRERCDQHYELRL